MSKDVDNPLSARLSFAFVSGGVGLSLISQPFASTAGRDFLRDVLHIPLWVPAALFLVVGLVTAYAALRDRGHLVERSLLAAALLWFAWAVLYTLPVLSDFRHAVFTGSVVFTFIALICLQGAKIETQRRLGIGAFAPRHDDSWLDSFKTWVDDERGGHGSA